MKESYREGVANHPGPDHARACASVHLKRWNRGICRLGIELRDERSGVPTPSSRAEGNTRVGRKREPGRGPAESKTPRTQRNSMRENWETLPPPAAVRRAGGRTR